MYVYTLEVREAQGWRRAKLKKNYEIARAFSACLRNPTPLYNTSNRTWNPMRRFFPLMPAWWAHIKNQRILNDYITGIIYRRWDLIQTEKAHPAGTRQNGNAGVTAAGNGAANGNGHGVGHNEKVSPPRTRDILDKVLDSLDPAEWGPAAVLQVRARAIKQFMIGGG